jgi:N-sulfoglucosamine sulfohydrolase
MRGVLDKKYAYIFNPWSDQTKEYRNANEGITFKAMQAEAQTDKKIAERVKMFRYREIEELYDLQKDPDCLNNLANSQSHAKTKLKYRKAMHEWMQEKGDPILAIQKLVDQPAEMKKVMDSIYATILKCGASIKD